MSYYETVANGGDSSSGPHWLTVHLYPFSDVTGTCQDNGKVTNAMENALEDLVSFGAIDYYEVLRFKTEDSGKNPPDGIDPVGSTESEFKEYLRGNADDNDPYKNNGTDDNLYSQVGVHELIHTNQNACDEDSEGYAPAGANAEGRSESAFSQGLVAWSPVCNYNDSLTKNAAVQEALHEFINPSHDDTWTGTHDDQHSLGKVIEFNSTGIVTPLLTYHWDDSKDKVGEGECPSDTDHRYTSDHTPYPTDCTKRAIRKTANEEIDDGV
jgi:hypothetical protein